jgi:hypothetical protein
MKKLNKLCAVILSLSGGFRSRIYAYRGAHSRPGGFRSRLSGLRKHSALFYVNKALF